jgi:outer membrane protein TolC
MRKPFLPALLVLTLTLAFALSTQAQEFEVPPKATLDEAIQRALEHNPNTRTAIANIKVAYAQMEEIRANSFPTLYATGTQTRLDGNRVAITGGIAVVTVPENQSVVALQLTLPLVAPKAWANWSRAVDQVDVNRVSFADTQRLVALATARAYLTVYATHLTVDVDLRAQENARAHLAFAQKRLQGGIGNRIDAVRAAQEVASDESQLENAYAQLVQAREALGVLMGVDGKPVDVTEAAPEGQLPPPPPLELALKRARGERSDVKVSVERLKAADHSLDLSFTEYLPSLAATFQPFWQNYANSFSPNNGWQAQLILSLPLYDGSLRYGLIHEREGNRTVSHLNLEATVRQAESDARSSFESLERANASWKAAKEAARLAHEALSLADLAYRAGATNELDVIDAERQARDADTQAASAEDNMLQAQLNLLNAAALFPKQT